MGTAAKAKEVKKSGTRFLDIKRRSRDMTRLWGRVASAESADDRVVKRMCGMVVSEMTWLCEVLNRARLKGEDAEKFKDIQKHLEKLHSDFEDEILRNQFIAATDARIVLDMAWLITKIEELHVVPTNEKPKEESLEDDDEDIIIGE